MFSTLQDKSRKWSNRSYLLPFVTACILVFFAVLIVHAYIGSFARYYADDYSFAIMLQSKGLFGVTQWWYLNWTGTFSSAFAISLMALIGPGIVPVLPSLALGLWLICMTWTIMQFTLKVHLPKPLLFSILLAVLLIATVLNTIPSIFQSLYWQTGMLVYLFPLIIFTVYVGLIGYSMRRKSKKSLSIFLLILSTLLAFIAGGCSQTFVVLQTGALFLVMGIGVLRSTSDFKRSALPLVVAGFLGSLIAMVITILSPGNAFREAYFPPHPDLFSLVKSSTINAFLYMGNYNFHQVTNIAIALVLPAVLAFTMHPTEPNPPTQPNPNSKRALIISLLLSPIVGFILIVFCFAPTIWGESVPLPPERAIIIPQFVLVCTAIYWAYHAGLAARHLHLPSKKMVASFSLILISISTIALLVFGPVKSIQRNVALIPEYRAYAAMWDSQNAELRAAKLKGEKVVTITALDTTRLPWLRGGTVGPDVNNWVNLAVAAYYGLDSITAVESP